MQETIYILQAIINTDIQRIPLYNSCIFNVYIRGYMKTNIINLLKLHVIHWWKISIEISFSLHNITNSLTDA